MLFYLYQAKPKYLDREAVSVSDTLANFPLYLAQTASTSCFVCGKDTSENGDFNPFAVGFSRVDGDSANGYEMHHLVCVEG